MERHHRFRIRRIDTPWTLVQEGDLPQQSARENEALAHAADLRSDRLERHVASDGHEQDHDDGRPCPTLQHVARRGNADACE